MANYRDYLFSELDWHGVAQSQKRKLSEKISDFSEKIFGEKTLEELVEQLCDEFSLIPPTVNKEEVEVQQREADIEISGQGFRDFAYAEPRKVKGTAIDVFVPFEGNPEMFRVQPTTFDYNPPRAKVEGKNIIFTIQGVSLKQEDVKAQIDKEIGKIETYLQYQKQSLGKYPEEIKRDAMNALKSRQAKLKSDNDLVSGLGFKTKK